MRTRITTATRTIRLHLTRRYWMTADHPHNDAEQHVYPNRDLMRHEADDCPCGPETHHTPTPAGDGWIIVHHSLDGRER